jgi:hypothetical protein
MKSLMKSLGGKAYEKMSADTTKTVVFIAMIIHIGVNIGNFAAVNDNKNDKKAKKETFQAHAIISSVVFGLLMLIKLFGLVPFVGHLLTQDIFQGGYSYIGVPFFIHLIVSIATAVLSFVIPDYDPQLLSNIFNVISTLVCVCVCIFAGFTTEQLNGMVPADATKNTAAPENVKVEVTDTGTNTEKKVDPNKDAFGKRQRRRNPRRKRY